MKKNRLEDAKIIFLLEIVRVVLVGVGAFIWAIPSYIIFKKLNKENNDYISEFEIAKLFSTLVFFSPIMGVVLAGAGITSEPTLIAYILIFGIVGFGIVVTHVPMISEIVFGAGISRIADMYRQKKLALMLKLGVVLNIIFSSLYCIISLGAVFGEREIYSPTTIVIIIALISVKLFMFFLTLKLEKIVNNPDIEPLSKEEFIALKFSVWTIIIAVIGVVFGISFVFGSVNRFKEDAKANEKLQIQIEESASFDEVKQILADVFDFEQLDEIYQYDKFLNENDNTIVHIDSGTVVQYTQGVEYEYTLYESYDIKKEDMEARLEVAVDDYDEEDIVYYEALVAKNDNGKMLVQNETSKTDSLISEKVLNGYEEFPMLYDVVSFNDEYFDSLNLIGVMSADAYIKVEYQLSLDDENLKKIIDAYSFFEDVEVQSATMIISSDEIYNNNNRYDIRYYIKYTKPESYKVFTVHLTIDIETEKNGMLKKDKEDVIIDRLAPLYEFLSAGSLDYLYSFNNEIKSLINPETTIPAFEIQSENPADDKGVFVVKSNYTPLENNDIENHIYEVEIFNRNTFTKAKGISVRAFHDYTPVLENSAGETVIDFSGISDDHDLYSMPGEYENYTPLYDIIKIDKEYLMSMNPSDCDFDEYGFFISYFLDEDDKNVKAMQNAYSDVDLSNFDTLLYIKANTNENGSIENLEVSIRFFDKGYDRPEGGLFMDIYLRDGNTGIHDIDKYNM